MNSTDAELYASITGRTPLSHSQVVRGQLQTCGRIGGICVGILLFLISPFLALFRLADAGGCLGASGCNGGDRIILQIGVIALVPLFAAILALVRPTAVRQLGTPLFFAGGLIVLYLTKFTATLVLPTLVLLPIGLGLLANIGPKISLSHHEYSEDQRRATRQIATVVLTLTAMIVVISRFIP